MNIITFKKRIRKQYMQQRSHEGRNRQTDQEQYLYEIRKEAKRSKLGISADQQEHLCLALLDDIFGYGPLQALMEDPKISEIMVNGPYHIFVEIEGRQRECTQAFDDEQHLSEILNRIVRRCNQRLDEANPTVNCLLEGNIRINAAISPVAINGPLVTLRKPQQDIQEIEDLLRRKSLNTAMYQFLWACIQAKINIMFSGATGSGKTTLLEVLSAYIDPEERLVLIEDVPELRIRQHNVARLCTRSANLEGKGEITLRDLFINSLRMRPTRIILGEIRGAEAFDYLQSINSGHKGSLAVIHANSPRDVGLRLENLAQLAGLNVPASVLRRQITEGLDLIIQIDRYPDGTRKITEISEVIGFDAEKYLLQPLFYYDFQGIQALTQLCIGEHKATGKKPTFIKRFQQLGLQLDPDIFVN